MYCQHSVKDRNLTCITVKTTDHQQGVWKKLVETWHFAGLIIRHSGTGRQCCPTRKFSCETASELRTSASIASSSRSIRSIFSRICCRADSEQRAARSEPTWPCVSWATCMQISSRVLHTVSCCGNQLISFHHDMILLLLPLLFPLPFNRQHLSYDDCLEVEREDNQNCSILCCVFVLLYICHRRSLLPDMLHIPWSARLCVT